MPRKNYAVLQVGGTIVDRIYFVDDARGEAQAMVTLQDKLAPSRKPNEDSPPLAAIVMAKNATLTTWYKCKHALAFLPCMLDPARETEADAHDKRLPRIPRKHEETPVTLPPLFCAFLRRLRGGPSAPTDGCGWQGLARLGYVAAFDVSKGLLCITDRGRSWIETHDSKRGAA